MAHIATETSAVSKAWMLMQAGASEFPENAPMPRRYEEGNLLKAQRYAQKIGERLKTLNAALDAGDLQAANSAAADIADLGTFIQELT